MITDKEIKAFWLRFYLIHLAWLLVYFIGFFSGLVIISHFLKHVCNLKIKFWLLNDTKDGDYGAEWWLIRKGLKPSLWSAFLWWWRNKAYNFYLLFAPEWNAGKVDEFRLIECTLAEIDMYDGNRYNKFTKANRRQGIYGINHYAYRINGNVYANYSEATEEKEVQRGVGGNELRLFRKPLFNF